MRKLLTWYALYSNRRYLRTGHLFENRYKSILCDEDNYLLALIRYIHLNPVRAGGHSAIMNKRVCPWMDTDYVLLQFNDTTRRARNAYRRFVQDGMGQGHCPELTGGGLIRSQGGWSQVLAMQSKGRPKEEYDQRILGGGDFVREILKEAEEKQSRQLKIRRAGRTIADIIREECKSHKVSDDELKKGNRRRSVSAARLFMSSDCPVRKLRDTLA
jgi:putative transposase